MIQNAHDAIVAKYDRPRPFYANEQITIEINPFADGSGYLDVTDTGTGMTEEELRENLGKIGDSSKLASAIQNPAVIGRFGIGFLSSFIVSERVEVTSRSEKKDEIWQWSTTDKANWRMERVSDDQMLTHGTRVRLYFSKVYPPSVSKRIHDLQDEEGLRKLVQRFAYLLPVPIKVQRCGERGGIANAGRPPWGSEADADSAARVLLNTKDQPLYTHRFERQNGGFKAAGVLYFRPHLTFTSSMRLYVRRMLVNEEDTSLLPEYALFATGFVDSPDPDVDLARRNVSQFDSAYQWLRQVVREEFEAAFIAFGRAAPETLAVKLWPRVDNSFIARLLHSFQGEDELEKTAAESFLVKAGRFVPFYLLDTISGGFGQPAWRSIDTLVTEAKGRGDAAKRLEASDGKVAIPYTNSSAPIEKDFLVQTYGEVIDVGREEKAHGQLMDVLATHNEKFPDFEVRRVTADRFHQLSGVDTPLWARVAALVQESVSFRGRDHRVQVERFEPKNNPVTITDTDVDQDEAHRLREVLGNVGSGGLKGELARMVTDLLDRVGAAGGLVTIHLNADNPTMVRLRDAYIGPDPEIVAVAETGLQQVVWRALLDYFGWRSTRDMIAKERNYTDLIMNALLSRATALQEAREQLKLAEHKRQEAEESNAAISKALEETAHGLTSLGEVIVGFIDIVSSTETIMVNHKLAPNQRNELMVALINRLQLQLDGVARPVSFTGDGLLFHFNKGAATEKCLPRLRSLADILERERDQFSALLPGLAGGGIHLRIALSWGPVHGGRIGPTDNLVGWPVVEAARLAAAKNFYPDGRVSIAATGEAVDAGIRAGLWNNGDWNEVDKGWVPGGFSASQTVYRHSRN
ncbi:MAG: ATP-binding protein [Alphaproteobacteria bacterium]